MTIKRLSIPALVLFIFALDCSAQSIVDLARKERERQKNAQSKVTVKSNVAGVTRTPATSANPSSAAPPVVKPVVPLDNKGRDEKYWRTAFEKARDDAKRAEDRVQLLDLKIKDLNTQYLRQSDIYNRENLVGAEITAAQKDLEDARKQAEQAKQKIADLEEELRRSGGPAGWAR